MRAFVVLGLVFFPYHAKNLNQSVMQSIFAEELYYTFDTAVKCSMQSSSL